MKKIFTTRRMVLLAILIALQIVIGRYFTLTINQFMKAGFVFVPNTIIGAIFGPIGSGIGLFIADILGYYAPGTNPGGPFFIGFSFSAMLVGVLYGLFYYKKEITLGRVIVATVFITLVSSLFLTPIWLTIMYNVKFWALMPQRFLKVLFSIPIQIGVTYWLLPRLIKISVVKKLQGDR